MPATSSGGSTIYPIGFPIPNSSQNMFFASGSAGGGGGDIVNYTVPAGKTAYIMGFTATVGNSTLKINAVSLMNNGSGAAPIIAGGLPFAIANSGDVIKVYVPSAASASVWGFTQ